MAINAPSTGARAGAAPRDPNFDPNRWLDDWHAAGGWTILSEDAVSIGNSLKDRDAHAQRRLWSKLDAKPGRRALVRSAAIDRWAR